MCVPFNVGDFRRVLTCAVCSRRVPSALSPSVIALKRSVLHFAGVGGVFMWVNRFRVLSDEIKGVHGCALAPSRLVLVAPSALDAFRALRSIREGYPSPIFRGGVFRGCYPALPIANFWLGQMVMRCV